MFKISCGIYKITNRINGHSYIGFSTNIESRFSDHKNKPFSSKRKDDQEKVLYKAIRKYGVENFNFEIIEECENDIELLKKKEIYWIEHYNTYKDRNHYNETPGGDIPGRNTIHLGEEHGMSKLKNEDVIFCRKAYKEGLRCNDIYKKYFKDKINIGGFHRMWHGQTWKHIMPEVFKHNPHKGKYGEKDCQIITERFHNSGLSLNKFQKTDECYVGYGTLYKMINNPEFYKGKNF